MWLVIQFNRLYNVHNFISVILPLHFLTYPFKRSLTLHTSAGFLLCTLKKILNKHYDYYSFPGNLVLWVTLNSLVTGYVTGFRAFSN